MLGIYDATKVCDTVVYIVDETSCTRGCEKLINGVAAQGERTLYKAHCKITPSFNGK